MTITNEDYVTYEQALSAGIDAALKPINETTDK